MTFDEIYTTVSTLVQQNIRAIAAVGDFRANLCITSSDGGVIGAQVTGGVPNVQKGSVGAPEATVSLSANDFAALLTGRLNPMMAVMTGRIKVSGNYAKLMSFMKGLKG